MVEYKVCFKCKENLRRECFYKCKDKKDGLQSICKTCSKARNRHNYQKNLTKYRKNIYATRAIRIAEKQQAIYDIKTMYGCAVCDEKYVGCIDFHHLPNYTKKYIVSTMVHSSYSIEKMIEEINKCVCVCSNCHRKIHDGIVKVDVMHKCNVELV